MKRYPWNRTTNTASRFFGLLLLALATLVLGVTPSVGDTITKKDGSVIVGKIVRETEKFVKIKTKRGMLSIRRRRIESIEHENDEGSALHDIATVPDFDKLNPFAQTLKNAESLYDLERFNEIPALVKPLLGKSTKIDDMRIRWLLIEAFEREGKWNQAEELLKKTRKDGRETDKIRAKAHLDIFERNPGHILVKIGHKRTVDFLSKEMVYRGRKKNALQSRDMMEAALLEYLEQILRDEKVSTETFRENLDTEKTLKIIREQTKNGSRNIIKNLGYFDELHQVEAALDRANAVLPGYAAGYELDLLRTEASHLSEVIVELLEELSKADPDTININADENGKLSKEARKQWREGCDKFVELSRPITQLIEYMLQRVRQYPVEMRRFIKDWEDTLERIEQMRQSAVRRRNRTRV